MQCLWIMIEEGNYYLKQQKYGKALRRFHQILDVRSSMYAINEGSVALTMIRTVADLSRYRRRPIRFPRLLHAKVDSQSVYPVSANTC